MTKEYFEKLKEIDEKSELGRLVKIIDDIDTAFDMFKPNMKNFEKFVVLKLREARKVFTSDGYKIYLTDEKVKSPNYAEERPYR